MKHKFIPLILASMAVGALAACGPKAPAVEPMPDKYDLMQHWEKDTATDEVYTVTQKEGSFEVSYAGASGNEWACVSRSFAYDTAKIARFSEYKKVVFKGKLDVTTGANNVMFKVQGDASNTREVVFGFDSSEKTYEMPLNFVSDWSKVSKLVFFANRNMNTAGEGKMTFTEFYLSKDEVVDANSIDKNAPSVPQDYTYYNGGDKLDVMYRWGYNDQIATAEANGKFTFTWGGADHPKAEWKYVSALFRDGSAAIATAGFKRVVFEFIGTAGKQATFKVQDAGNTAASEKHVTMTGELQTVELDATAVLANADATGFMLLIFPEGAVANPATAGQIELSKAFIDKTEVTPEVNPQQYNVYAGNETMKVMTDWRAKEDSITVAPSNDNTYRISWGAKGDWDCARALVKNDDTHSLKTDGVNYAKYTINGDSGKEVILKVEAHNVENGQDKGNKGQKELRVTMTGEDQVVEFEVTNAIQAADYNEVWVLVMPQPGVNATAEGALVLKDVELYKKEVQPDPDAQKYNVYNGGDKLTVMTDWRDAVYSTTTADTDGWVISWEGQKNDAWANTKARAMNGEATIQTAGFKRVVYEVNATKATRSLFKIETHAKGVEDASVGAKEVWADLEPGATTVEVDVSEIITADYYEIWVLIFPDASKTGVREANSIKLTDCYFDKTEVTPVVEPKNILNWSGVYFDYVTGGNLPGTSKGNHVIEIEMDNLAATWGINSGFGFEPSEDWFVNNENMSEYQHVYLKIKSTVATECLLKPFDAFENRFALEANVEKVIEFDVPAASIVNKATFLFPHRGDATNTDPVTGTITITDFQITRKNVGLNGRLNETVTASTTTEHGYTFSHNENNDLVVAFDKEALGYDSFQVITNVDSDEYKHVTGTITADHDVHMIFKNDNGGEEIRVLVRANESYTLDITFTQGISAKWGKLLFMVGTGEQETSALAASVTFANLRISK